VVTAALRRTAAGGVQAAREGRALDALLSACESTGARLLPNTAGCRSAREAILLAEMARELFDTSWIKLEITGDEATLAPDPFELVSAARELVRLGFEVLPYCSDDLVACRRLLDTGCRIIMPGAAPIGSARGLLDPAALRTLRERLPGATLIVDAGLGAPSHAAQAMEMGFDAVLVNSAVALAVDPERMAGAFAHGVAAGRLAYEAGLVAPQDTARPSTPVTGEPILIDTPGASD
jgi:thiazole synthase